MEIDGRRWIDRWMHRWIDRQTWKEIVDRIEGRRRRKRNGAVELQQAAAILHFHQIGSSIDEHSSFETNRK